MNFLKNNYMEFFKYKVKKVWLTDTEITAELEDGRKASLLIKNFPLLAKAAKQDREKFEVIGGYALHWPALGEDLSIAGFFEQDEDVNASDAVSLVATK